MESFWLLNGPGNQSDDAKKQMEDDFQSVTEWLLTGGIDFDYVAESSLADEGERLSDGKLHCGEMAYDVLLVPSCLNIRKSTLEAMIQFSEAGGALFFVGDPPRCADCVQDASLDRLVESSQRINLSRQTLLETLNPWREVDFLENGQRTCYISYVRRKKTAGS